MSNCGNRDYRNISIVKLIPVSQEVVINFPNIHVSRYHTSMNKWNQYKGHYQLYL